jgi:hypothetical protein
MKWQELQTFNKLNPGRQVQENRHEIAVCHDWNAVCAALHVGRPRRGGNGDHPERLSQAPNG